MKYLQSTQISNLKIRAWHTVQEVETLQVETDEQY